MGEIMRMKLLKNRGFIFISTAFLLLLIGGCASSPKIVNDIDYENISLNGMTYNQEGLPVKKVLITIDNRISVVSDYNGRFTIPSIKAGDHTIQASCTNHEKYIGEFTLKEPSELLYISLVSFDELVSYSEKCIKSKEWAQADAYVNRALTVDKTDIRARYLQAVLLATKQRIERSPEKAREILTQLLGEGYTNPAIYLFLADLSQYDFSDTTKACEYLTSYLKQRTDIGVEKRLNDLQRTMSPNEQQK
jgi:hypothetical protein